MSFLRISDIYSWRWVLEDLSKRLDDATCSLNYELKALKVVSQRVQKEIDDHCIERTKPAALCPLSDAVEEAIIQVRKLSRKHQLFCELSDRIRNQASEYHSCQKSDRLKLNK